MSSIQKLKEIGESLGLNGDNLVAFIEKQQAEEWALRAAEREQQKFQAEMEQENERLWFKHTKINKNKRIEN